MTRSPLLLLPFLGFALAGCAPSLSQRDAATDLSGLHEGQQIDRMPLASEAKTIADRYGLPLMVTGAPAEVSGTAQPSVSLYGDLINLVARSEPSRCAAVVRDRDGTPKAIFVTPLPVVQGAPFAPVPLPAAPTPTCVTTVFETEAARLWSAAPGASVRSVFMSWATQAGFNLIWTAQNDPGRTAGAAVYGAFSDAAQAFVQGGSPHSMHLSIAVDDTRRMILVTDWSLPQ